MPVGDDLTVVLFLVGTGITIVVSAMIAAGWRHPTFIYGLIGIGAVLVLAGVTWPVAKGISPAFTEKVNQVATNPVAWFVVLMLAIVAGLLPPRSRTPLFALGRSRTRSADKMFIDVEIDYLRGLYKDRTSIQGDTLAAAYIGKWTRISGPVTNVTPYSLTKKISVDVRTSKDEYSMPSTFWFSENWRDEVGALTKGSNINAIGRISQIGAHSVMFDNCELVA